MSEQAETLAARVEEIVGEIVALQFAEGMIEHARAHLDSARATVASR